MVTAIKHPVPDWVKPSFVIWASECPGDKNYKWWLNPVWHRMHYSCTHMVTVGVKGLIQPKAYLNVVDWIWLQSSYVVLVSCRRKDDEGRNSIRFVVGTMLEQVLRDDAVRWIWSLPSNHQTTTETWQYSDITRCWRHCINTDIPQQPAFHSAIVLHQNCMSSTIPLQQ